MTCLRKYATVSGRAPRSEFWWFALFVLVSVALLLAVTSRGGAVSKTTGLLIALIAIPLVAAGARRLQDGGKPGWFMAVPLLVPLLYFAILIILLFLFGSAGPSGGPGEIFYHIMNSTGFALYWAGLPASALIIAFFLVSPSQPGPTKYGPPPSEDSS